MLVTSSSEIKIWNIDKSFDQVNEYPVFSKSGIQKPVVNWFSIKADNNQIASVVNKEWINILNLDTNTQFELKEAIQPKCCQYDSLGRHLAVGNSNSIIELYDFKSQTLKRKAWKLPSICGEVNCISWSKNDRFIVTGNSNGSLVLFNTVLNSLSKPWMFSKSMQEIKNSVTAIQYTNTQSIGAVYEDGSFVLWDSTKEVPTCSFRNHSLTCTSLVLSPLNFQLMVCAGLDGLLNLYDITSKKHLKPIVCKEGISSLDLLKNGYTLAAGSINGNVHMYDLRSKTDESFMTIKVHDREVFCLKFMQPAPPGINKLPSHQIPQHHQPSLDSNLNSSSSISLMKKSNSYNFDQHNSYSNSLNSNGALSYGQSFNLFSPETSNRTINNLNTNNTSGQQLYNNNFDIITNQNCFSSSSATSSSSNCAESFILHKKQQQIYNSTSNINNNTKNESTTTTSMATTPILSNNSTSINNNESKISNSVNKTQLASTGGVSTAKISSRIGDLYSPIGNNSIESFTNTATNINSLKNGTITPKSHKHNDIMEDSILVHQTSPSGTTNPIGSFRVSNNNINNNNIIDSSNQNENLNSNTRTPKNQLILNKNQMNSISPLGALQLNGKSPTNGSLMNHHNFEQQIKATTTTTTTLTAAVASNQLLIPYEQIKEIIKDHVDDLKDELMSDNFKLRADILKEFMYLKQEMIRSMQNLSVNEALMEEIARLREENKRLKKLFKKQIILCQSI